MAKSVISSNSINVRLFSAIKMCEKANLPLLILSNPGFAKSSTVMMYAEITGRELIQLRSNSTTHEEVVGYDTVPSNVEYGKAAAATHLRPSWFQKLMDADAAGKDCILFLDEITTAHSQVQAALLHLIFERKCGDEPIPESTLIISAGNYMTNLNNDLSGLMAPTMNRFVIYNLRLETADLDAFLGHYSGAMMGKRINFEEELMKALKHINDQEVEIPEDRKYRILELLEGGIKDQTKMLMTHGDKPLDMNESDLESIYDDIEDTDGKVLGFITPRTLYYSVKLAYSAYQCFGKAGLQSDVFRSLLEGLVGLALKRDKKTGDVKKKQVGGEYFSFLQQVANDIEKLKNTKLPEYEKFFVSVLKDKSEKASFKIPEMQAAINKLKEIEKDPELVQIERPVPVELMKKMCDVLDRTSLSICNELKLSTTSRILDVISSEELINKVVEWNKVAELDTCLLNIACKKELGYPEDGIQYVKNITEKIKKTSFKLRSIRKMVIHEDKSFGELIPEVSSLIDVNSI